MGKTTSRTTSRVCLQTKSSHTVIGQFCIRIICRSCTINVVRSPSTGPFGVNLNCLRINTEILKCPIPLWTDLGVARSPRTVASSRQSKAKEFQEISSLLHAQHHSPPTE